MLAGVLLAICFLAALLALRTVSRRSRVEAKARSDRQTDGPSTRVFAANEVPRSFFDAPTDRIVLGEPDRPPPRTSG